MRNEKPIQFNFNRPFRSRIGDRGCRDTETNTPPLKPASFANYSSIANNASPANSASPTPITNTSPIEKVKKRNKNSPKTQSKLELSEEASDDPTPGRNTGNGYHLGPRGGCFYYGGTGRKVYVERSLCSGGGGGESSDYTAGKSLKQSSGGSSSSGYIRGPRGGCYYMTAGGNKKYVDRSLCN